MNTLPKKQIEKLKEIIARIYGVELSDDEARTTAERIVGSMLVLPRCEEHDMDNDYPPKGIDTR
jgi:hypothetical protein